MPVRPKPAPMTSSVSVSSLASFAGPGGGPVRAAPPGFWARGRRSCAVRPPRPAAGARVARSVAAGAGRAAGRGQRGRQRPVRHAPKTPPAEGGPGPGTPERSGPSLASPPRAPHANGAGPGPCSQAGSLRPWWKRSIVQRRIRPAAARARHRYGLRRGHASREGCLQPALPMTASSGTSTRAAPAPGTWLMGSGPWPTDEAQGPRSTRACPRAPATACKA